MSGDLIPEDAIEAAKRADHKARNTAMFKASDSVSIQDDAVRAVLEAAAPLILAAANEQATKRLMVLAQKITTQASQASRSGQMQALEDITFEVAEIARSLRPSASVLRGEGDRNG